LLCYGPTLTAIIVSSLTADPSRLEVPNEPGLMGLEMIRSAGPDGLPCDALVEIGAKHYE
jgi:hypothetical protein